MSRPRVFIVSGPSGVGKSSLIHGVLDSRVDMRLSVSSTTRPIRAGEVDGRDYHFTDAESFEALIELGSFLEWARSYDNYYGTLVSEIDNILAAGCHVLLDIDTQGALQIQAAFNGAVYMFILPPSLEELEARLRGRGSETGDVLQKRLDRARSEIGFSDRYDYRVVNDDIDRAVAELNAIIDSEAEKDVSFTRLAEAGEPEAIAGQAAERVTAKATRYALEHVDQDALIRTLEDEVRVALRGELEDLIRERLERTLREDLLRIVEETYWEMQTEGD